MVETPMIDDLRAILAKYPATARPLSDPESLGTAGGLSGARLWRFASSRGLLVARAWPPHGRDRQALEQVHRWMGATGRLGFVPVPLSALDGQTLHERGGRLWELTPWLPGSPDLGRPPARARLRAGFAALATFHQSLAFHTTVGPSPGLARRLEEIDKLRRGGFESLEQALIHRSDDPSAFLGRRWLDMARPLASPLADRLRRVAGHPVALQPCLRDVRAEHLLFEGDWLSGLIDYGAMDIDSVACDLARLLADWLGPDRSARAEALAAYATSRPLNESEIGLIEAFEASAAFLGGGLWVRWHFVEALTFDDPAAVRQGLERGLERIELLACPGPDPRVVRS
jgi:Ser/Thr protein kinase RdoA (MazF antagonist)